MFKFYCKKISTAPGRKHKAENHRNFRKMDKKNKMNKEKKISFVSQVHNGEAISPTHV